MLNVVQFCVMCSAVCVKCSVVCIPVRVKHSTVCVVCCIVCVQCGIVLSVVQFVLIVLHPLYKPQWYLPRFNSA